MDPNALIAEIIESGEITDDQRDAFNEWIYRGGFSPVVEIDRAADRFGSVYKLSQRHVYVELRAGLARFEVARVLRVAS